MTPSVGAFAKWAIDAAPDALGPPAPIEVDYHGNRPLAEGNRLGCAARIVGDVVVDVPAASQVHRQVVRKDLDLAPIVVDPAFRLYYVEVPAARLGDASRARRGRCRKPSPASTGSTTIGGLDPSLLPSLHRLLAADEGASRSPCTSRSMRSATIVAVWPGYVDAAFGVAVDVGSTTVAGHLCDLATGEVLASAGRMNPQIRFGEDLMSRVSYVMMNPGGERELTAVVRRRTQRARRRAGRGGGRPAATSCSRSCSSATRSCTTSSSASTRRRSARRRSCWPPTRPVTGRRATSTSTCPTPRSTSGRASPVTSVPTPPRRSSPRARTAATAMQLLVDVGTNAEIVLGDRTGMFAASSPTGPAFEGAQISCGQRATAGAIERVRIDRETLEPVR